MDAEGHPSPSSLRSVVTSIEGPWLKSLPHPPAQLSDHPSEPVSPSIFVGESTQLREDSLIVTLSMEPAQGAPGGITATHQNSQSQQRTCAPETHLSAVLPDRSWRQEASAQRKTEPVCSHNSQVMWLPAVCFQP